QDDLRWILEVRVDDHNRIAARIIPAGGDCNLVSEVSRKDHGTHARVPRPQLADLVRGTIGGTIVHQNQFPGFSGRIHHFFDTTVQFGNILQLVIDRGNNGIGDFHSEGFSGRGYSSEGGGGLSGDTGADSVASVSFPFVRRSRRSLRLHLRRGR